MIWPLIAEYVGGGGIGYVAGDWGYRAWMRRRDRQAVPPRNVVLLIDGRPPVPLELIYEGYWRRRWRWVAVFPDVIPLDVHDRFRLTSEFSPPRTAVRLLVALPGDAQLRMNPHPDDPRTC